MEQEVPTSVGADDLASCRLKNLFMMADQIAVGCFDALIHHV